MALAATEDGLGMQLDTTSNTKSPQKSRSIFLTIMN
jgi:hypothetical protein